MATLQEVGFSADDVRDALLTVGLWGSVDVAAEALLEQDSDDDAVKTARKERVAAGIEADKADPRELCQRVRCVPQHHAGDRALECVAAWC